ncbi:MAG: crossover junction endodeoxyribonuclease RuvC [Gammaproteobacteria bacterium]|nr:crossover junction endodeoxyribonuclease RuvC [Gammaproteobacteria bacterium]MXW48803.1 crossover junction endodeoxyribonuclease RuvC [Gammaproteobacteria bacterium]MYE50767.1 crossover junction endodeoxyribonuclease RuvC [Gammaproteobacteria bacterium]MYE85211.1 crossover junction endodeoxyribonuclease RuvC [Gammaproteobacteria bacterium]MYF09629.1 crossover junction endodeoxyribonuclease RuvC [Gammaproteobacteria bacterium]
MNPVRVLGIDPGTRSTGYGLVEAVQGRIAYIASGCIRPAAGAMAERLGEIQAGISELIAAHGANQLAIEEVFMSRNPQAALKLGQARGVAMATAVAAGLAVFEYAPRTVKKAVVGTGGATKAQVQHMVRILLNLRGGRLAADAADALAIAICHVNTASQDVGMADRNG